MADFRIPVDGAKWEEIARSLPCIDLDPVTGERVRNECKDRWQVYEGSSFSCPNRREGGCSRAAFLYPRKRRSNGDFHFHQGVDIGWVEGRPIRSVTGGKVVVAIDEYRGGWNYYGKVVVVEGEELPYYFLYAHCQTICVAEGQRVRAGQQIATVGRTFYNSSNPTQLFLKGPHLHFEVLTSMSGSVRREETQLGADKTRLGGTDQPRLDPIYILEKLGPWGMTEVHLPWGGKMTRSVADLRHRSTESSPIGGCFPLGANNHWHGGLHLPAPQGSPIVAPFDATIVAARLDPDPTLAKHPAGGHTNFILLRHELAEDCYALFQGKDPADVDPTSVTPTTTPKKRAVGTKSSCANRAADVTTVKHRLHAHGYYPPKPDDLADLDAPSVSKVLSRAIEAFQRDHVPSISADGVVDIPGKTWTALHDGSPPPEPDPAIEPEPDAPTPNAPTRPPDPKRVVYSLLMHLQPLPLTNATADAFPWLTQVKLEPDPTAPDPAEEEAKRAAREREEDRAEAEHELDGSVGAASAKGTPATNDPEDVQWVHRRLIRFGYHSGPPSSTCDEALTDAIRRFQNDHHPSFEKHDDGDGRVDTTGDTVTLLAKTCDELLGGSRHTASLDPVFVHRATQRDAHGTAKVITGLRVSVRSKEPLWRSGQAAGTTADGNASALHDQIHWELFSEHLLVHGWETPIEDDDDGITADVPQRIAAMIDTGIPELAGDGLFQPQEIHAFYTGGRAQFLRRTPCRFMSHWALDVPGAVATLDAMGFDPTGVAELLRPFMWWDQARDVLPAAPIVWHYNPVEFLAQYAEHLEALRPETRDPATHGTLAVRVRFDNGLPMPDVKLWLYQGLDPVRSARTGKDGVARLYGVPAGEHYWARIDDPPGDSSVVEVLPGTTTEVEIHTDEPGPPLPRGSIYVTVRTHGYSIAGHDVEVWLTHAQAGPVKGDTTRFGKVSFENIVHGDYTITAGDAEPVEVTLDKKSRKVDVVLPRPDGTLRVVLLVDGEPATRRKLDVLDEQGVVASAVTDGAGVAELVLTQGRYVIRVGTSKKKVYVEGNTTTPCTVRLDREDLPDEEGVLAVSVIDDDDGRPAPTALVTVSGPGVLEGDFPNASGVAVFRLPPGDYTVEADDRATYATVYADVTVWVELEV